MFGRTLTATFVFALLAACCPAQSSQQDSTNSGTPPDSAKPAPAAQTKPAKGASAQAAPAKDQPANPPAVKPKKVWTNDDLSAVKGTISVVGDPKANSTNRSEYAYNSDSNGNDHQNETVVKPYRDSVHDLQSQIDAIDQRIAQLKNFKAENTGPSGGLKMHQSYNMVPLEDQVKQLEQKKKKLQDNLDEVEAQARKNGIDPGELR